MNGKIFRKNIEIDDYNKKERYFVAKISTSDLDKQKDIILPEALENVYKNQRDCCVPVNIEHKANLTCGYAMGDFIDFKKHSDRAELFAKCDLLANKYGDIGVDEIDSNKIFASIEGGGVKATRHGLIKHIHSFTLTGIAITNRPANPNAQILELHKSFTDIFSAVKNKKDWKNAVSQYVLEGYIDVQDSTIGQWFEFFKQENFNIDKIDSIFELFPLYYNSIEDDLFTPMIESAKNIVATKTTDFVKSETKTDFEKFQQYVNNR